MRRLLAMTVIVLAVAVLVGRLTAQQGTCALPLYPDASCTGVPPGTTLTAYTGPSNITVANTIIDSKIIGCLQVSAPGVIIRNSTISCSGTAVLVNDADLYLQSRLTIQDSEIDCGLVAGSAGLSEAHVTLTRVEIQRCENGLDLNQDVTVQDSFIHNLASVGPDPHEDGIQFGGGHWNGSTFTCTGGCAKDITIQHNTIYGRNYPSDSSDGTSSIITNPNFDNNILIQNNLFGGGAYTLYCNRPGSGTNFRVLNNHFSMQWHATVGAFGYWDDCENETAVSGNVYHPSLVLIPGQMAGGTVPAKPLNVRVLP